MHFSWDSAKNEANQRKHRVRFEAAVEVFDDPFCIFKPDRVVDGGQRWHVIGSAADLTLLFVVHTVRGENEDEIRIISARRVERDERRIYEDSAL